MEGFDFDNDYGGEPLSTPATAAAPLESGDDDDDPKQKKKTPPTKLQVLVLFGFRLKADLFTGFTGFAANKILNLVL